MFSCLQGGGQPPVQEGLAGRGRDPSHSEGEDERLFLLREGNWSRPLAGLYRKHVILKDIYSTFCFQVSPTPLVDLKEGSSHVCKPIYDAYQNAAENYFIKYGEISHYYGRAEDALAKQKHRVMWERRHGPIGSGMKVEVKEE